jgi:ABC-type nitrate/sulfonate/bicarbonate transport system substrate-binding protein
MGRAVSRRAVVISAGSLLASRAVWAAGAGRPIRVASASGNLNLAVAALMRQEQLLEGLGLDPDIMMVADGARILGGIVGGSVDVCLNAGFGQLFPAVERGGGLKVLAGGSLLPGLALFSAKPGVRTLKDLEGKAIGAGSIGALAYQLTVSLLQKYGVDLAGIRFVNIGASSDVFRAVAAGTVDAGVGESSMIDTAAHYGVHLLEHGNMTVELRQYTFQGAWASDRTIAHKRDLLVRALGAYARLYRFVQSPAAQAAFFRACHTAFPTAPEGDFAALWNYIQNYKPFAVNLVLAPERLRYMQQLNIGFKVQTTVLPFERVADMSLAREALRLIGDTGTAAAV